MKQDNITVMALRFFSDRLRPGASWQVHDLLVDFGREVQLAEREACAKVCESMPYRAASAGKAADVIRARSKA